MSWEAGEMLRVWTVSGDEALAIPFSDFLEQAAAWVPNPSPGFQSLGFGITWTPEACKISAM